MKYATPSMLNPTNESCQYAHLLQARPEALQRHRVVVVRLFTLFEIRSKYGAGDESKSVCLNFADQIAGDH